MVVLIHHGNLTIMNFYAPNKRISNYIKKKLIKTSGEIDKVHILWTILVLILATENNKKKTQ